MCVYDLKALLFDAPGHAFTISHVDLDILFSALLCHSISLGHIRCERRARARALIALRRKTSHSNTPNKRTNERTDGRTHALPNCSTLGIVQHCEALCRAATTHNFGMQCQICVLREWSRASQCASPARQHSLSSSKAESTEQKLQLCDCVRCVCVYFEAARATYDLSVPPIIHCLCSPLCVPFHLSILSLSLCLSVPVPALRARIQFVRRNIRNNKMERYIYLIR